MKRLEIETQMRFINKLRDLGATDIEIAVFIEEARVSRLDVAYRTAETLIGLTC